MMKIFERTVLILTMLWLEDKCEWNSHQLRRRLNPIVWIKFINLSFKNFNKCSYWIFHIKSNILLSLSQKKYIYYTHKKVWASFISLELESLYTWKFEPQRLLSSKRRICMWVCWGNFNHQGVAWEALEISQKWEIYIPNFIGCRLGFRNCEG